MTALSPYSHLESPPLMKTMGHPHRTLDELKSKKWKFAKSDIGSWFVVGSLAVTAAATGVPVWGIAAIVADQLPDTPKLKDIPDSIKGLATESRDLDKSPVGILFKYANK